MRSSALVMAVGIAAILSVLVQAQEIDWGQNVYRPGTAEGRQPSVTDKTLTPKWIPRSNAGPSIVELGENYLRLGTGDAENRRQQPPQCAGRSWACERAHLGPLIVVFFAALPFSAERRPMVNCCQVAVPSV